MEIKAKGIDQVQGFLEDLVNKEAKKIAKAASRDGCKPLLAQAQANVPVRTGKLKASLKIKTGGGTKGKNRVSASVRTDSKNLYKGDTFYAGMIENGWEQVPTYRIGGRIKSMPRKSQPTTKREGRKYMRRAIEQGAAAAVEAFAASVKVRFEALKVKQ